MLHSLLYGYRISEENGMNKPIMRYGTEGADTIVGTAADEQVFALQGDDRVYGRAGDDDLYGNKGNDSLDGSAGRDAFFDGAGNDRSWGGAGDDIFFDYAGADRMWGGAGRDEMYPSGDRNGADIAWGGDDVDTFYMQEARARAYGEAGDDRFNFNFGNGGTVTGGEGADSFFLIARPGDRVDATIADFKLGEDELDLSTFDEATGEQQTLTEIVASFDANRDGELSPDDGFRQVQADGDYAWFRQDSAGDVTGLDLRVEDATVRLAGVDLLLG